MPAANCAVAAKPAHDIRVRLSFGRKRAGPAVLDRPKRRADRRPRDVNAGRARNDGDLSR
jgi:hypothetical protein